MSPRLFGTSGIRGVANAEVTPLLALRVGAALASQLDGGAVVVGRDTRLSGEMLEAALVAGIASCGCEATALGVVPTPVLAYLTRELEADAGVSISASHNPPKYNGLKLFDSTSMAYTEERQRQLEELIGRGGFDLSTWDAIGAVKAMDARRMYVDALAEDIRLERRWKIACDLFNGATSTVAPDVFRELGCEATLINAQPDGRFPAGEPEPAPGSLRRLGRMVKAVGAEIGFGFDGDGDRMMAVDEEGRPPNPDRVLAAYARHAVDGNRGGVVVTHIGASMCIEEAVAEAGGSVVRTKVGDVSIAEAMRRQGAVFGGEPVGAWIHPEVHLCPDGIVSALKLMGALEEAEETLAGFIADIPEHPLLRDKVECPDQRKAEVMKAISSRYRDAFGDMRSASAIDGVRLDVGDGWTLIRPSGTEPVIRITVEARGRRQAEELMERSWRFVMKALEGVD
ncbi:MAG: phosphoglucosamine mutase [Candidatus Bathyarchaeota archaeon]|nr:phosphoglucosamine mutase [Candidatus Bathyarchaeota archaeon]